jgi:hypothetical protein
LVTGAVDGVLIPIDGPNVGEEAFVDRYGDHSVNVMAVCGPDSFFYFILLLYKFKLVGKCT